MNFKFDGTYTCMKHGIFTNKMLKKMIYKCLLTLKRLA